MLIKYATGREKLKVTKDPYELLLQGLAVADVVLSGASAVVDDIYTLSVMGVLDKEWKARTETLCSTLWMLSVILDIHEIIQKRQVLLVARKDLMRSHKAQNLELINAGATVADTDLLAQADEMEAIEEKLRICYLSVGKLSMDFLYCVYDLFPSARIISKEGMPAVFGLTAGILGAIKTWRSLT